MLLELYVAHLMQRKMSITELCHASRVPATTAMRWMEAIRAEKLIARERDPYDGRRVFVELTQKGADSIRHYFEAVRGRVWPIESANRNYPQPGLAA